jgi:hypothetical protein
MVFAQSGSAPGSGPGVGGSNPLAPTNFLPIPTMAGEVASSNLIIPEPFFQNEPFRRSRRTLYVDAILSASITPFGNKDSD